MGTGLQRTVGVASARGFVFAFYRVGLGLLLSQKKLNCIDSYLDFCSNLNQLARTLRSKYINTSSRVCGIVRRLYVGIYEEVVLWVGENVSRPK